MMRFVYAGTMSIGSVGVFALTHQPTLSFFTTLGPSWATIVAGALGAVALVLGWQAIRGSAARMLGTSISGGLLADFVYARKLDVVGTPTLAASYVYEGLLVLMVLLFLFAAIQAIRAAGKSDIAGA